MKLSAYLKKSITTGLGNSVGSALISIVFIPLIIQKIGMEKYGIWALLFIFIGISSTADLGLSKSLVYFIPKQTTKEDVNEVYSAGFFVNSLMVLFVGVVGIIVYWSGVNVWGNNESLSYELGRKLLLCGLIIACCSLATSLYRSILEATYKIYIVNIGFLLLTTLNYVSIYILSLFTGKLEYFILCTTVVYGIILFFHLFIVHFTMGVFFHIPRLSTIKGIVKYSFSFFSIGILSSIVLPFNRYLFALLSGDMKAYGIFDVALKIAMIANSCLTAFGTPLFSIFAGYGRTQLLEIKRILNRYFIGLGGIYIFGCLLFFISGKYFLDIFIKVESLALFNVSLVLILGIGLSGVAEPFTRALWALGHLRLSFKTKIVLPVMNFSLIIVFAKMTPIYRFGMAYSLAFAITSLVVMVSFKVKYSN